MGKRIISLVLTLVLTIGFVFSASISASAATGLRGTVTGTMQDTSDPSNGVLTWRFTYDRTRGSASLNITGNGYMPNYTTDSWLEVQNEVQCYVTELTIGEGVKSICDSAFMYEIYLTSVNLPESLERIGEGAFAYTGIKALHIPSRVEKLSGRMFFNSPIEVITVSESNPYYKSYDGDVYSKDMKTLFLAAPGKFTENSYHSFTIPSTVTTISQSAFYMSQIRELIIPSNVVEIKNMAFAGSSLESIKMDSGIKMIYDSAFLACNNLTEVVLPSSLTYLGWYCFGYGYMLDVESIEYVLDEHGVSHGAITPENCEAYLAQIDYTPDQFMVIAPTGNMSIYAIPDSVGEKYAKENECIYNPVYADFARPLSAEMTNGGVLVEWNYVSNATGYRVLRKNAINQWDVIGTVKGNNSFIDNNPIENYVNEYSVESFGNGGSAYFDKTGVSCYYIKAPRLVCASVASNGITINWETVNGAYNYHIYRKAIGDVQWKQYATVSGGITYFTDSHVESGKKYSYTVSASNANAESFYDVNGLSQTFVVVPRIAVYNIASGVAVRWEYSGAADAFKIYRKTSSTGWSLVYTAKGNERVYTDKNIVYGTEYQYKTEVCVNGSESQSSQSGGAVIAMQSPMRFTVQNRVSGIQVKWSECKGAKGYYVYRRTVSSGWRRIAVINGEKQTSYLDTGITSGNTYIYTVKSFNGKYMSTYNTNGRRTIFLSTPKAYNVKSTKDGMRVTYTAAGNAQGYYIYRRTPSSTWKLVGNVKNGNTTVFYDASSKKGETYTYTVRAYKNGVRSSYYSYGYRVKDVH